jgi:hypothetical protein
LFETPTVEALACIVGRAKDTSPGANFGAIQRLKREDWRVDLSPTTGE